MRAGLTTQGQPATADVTMTFSGFDEDVNLRIPDEATSGRPDGESRGVKPAEIRL